MSLLLTPYSSGIDRASFSCGVIELDRFIREQATQHCKKGMCSVTLLMDGNRLAGFYSLSPFALHMQELPTQLAKKFPRNLLLPCWLVGRLAVDQEFRGRHYGAILLTDAMQRIKKLAAEAEGYGVIVDAKTEEVKTFYEQFGFREIQPGGMRLLLPVRSIA